MIVNEIGLRSGSISAVKKLRLSLGLLNLKQLEYDLDMSFLSYLQCKKTTGLSSKPTWIAVEEPAMAELKSMDKKPCYVPFTSGQSRMVKKLQWTPPNPHLESSTPMGSTSDLV